MKIALIVQIVVLNVFLYLFNETGDESFLIFFKVLLVFFLVTVLKAISSRLPSEIEPTEND